MTQHIVHPDYRKPFWEDPWLRRLALLIDRAWLRARRAFKRE